MKVVMNRMDTKYGPRPSDAHMGELGFSRVFGKQFRYIYPITKSARKLLKQSTMDWTIDYPKDKDLQWKIKRPGELSYTLSDTMPYEHNGDSVNHNSGNVNKISDKYGVSTLDNFFT